MNCLLLRRFMLIAPRHLSEEAHEHLESCAPCRAFVHAQKTLERELEFAIQVPVDPTLAHRIVLNHRLRAGFQMRWYAVAATILGALALGLGLGYSAFAPAPTLVRASVEHVLHEHVALERQEVVADADVAQAFALSGGALKKSLGRSVTYLSTCRVPGGLGKHLVLATGSGKVTVVTMPNQNVSRQVKSQHAGFTTAIIPAPRGSYALVADSDREIAEAAELLHEFVSWRI